MSQTSFGNVGARWTDGVLEFYNTSDGATILKFDGPNKTITIPSGSTLDATAGTSQANPYVVRATVAAAGSNQGTAAAITAGYTTVTAADGTKGVILPAGAAGQEFTITNTDGTTNALKVYPPTGGSINGGSANASINVSASKTATFYFDSATAIWAQAGA